ncbi:MAG: RHS repeat-associated core domain-containing protein, partial [Terracidiphilus sp.]
ATNALDSFTYGYAPGDATSRITSVTSTAGPTTGMTYYNTPQDELLKHIGYTNSAAATLMTFGYTKYDSDDRLMTANLPSATTNQAYTYTFDPANRLTSATLGPTMTPQYVYTPNPGSDLTTITINGATQNYTYSDVNTINSTTANPTIYDANGSPTALRGYGYAWDGANRLFTSANPNPTSASAFFYDGLGRLGRVVERNSAGAVTADHAYLWCGRAPCLAHDNTQSGSPVSTEYFPQGAIIAGTNYYYLKDQLGSVNALVTTAGAIATQYTFDPYGNRTLISGTVASDIGYAGYFAHAATGLDFTMHRAFDPVHGRWLNRDPIGESGGVNLYAYVGGNPISNIDSTGLTTYVITTYDTALGISYGSHSALFISTTGQTPFLYDPAGSFSPD